MRVYIEELEYKVGERLKSVLVLVLGAFLLVELGGNEKVEQTVGTAYVEQAQSNPVDAFFEERMELAESGSEQEIITLIWLECWEKELVHGYALLAERLPFAFAEEEAYGMSALKHFGAFTEAQGYLEAYSLQQGDWEQLQLVKTQQKLQLVREQTLRLYGRLHGVNSEEDYVFDVREAEEMLQNSGI